MSTALEPVAARPFNTLAALSIALTFVTVIGGIVTGHVALAQIRRSGERGRGLAVAALVIGYAVVAGTLLLSVGTLARARLLHATA